MEHELHFEHGDLTGEISVTLNEGQSLDDIFMNYILDYNRDRFEAVAARIFFGKETVVTLFAIDKLRQEDSTVPDGKIPVRKFKIVNIPLQELLPHIAAFNCTLGTNNYPLEAMEVGNR
ncbi:MAG: hypothetical protein ABIN36_00615 [Ferruginibacter sp.]